jgi:S-DNA-T family DNA segregation ATPase FtsK/SpoIIIE
MLVGGVPGAGKSSLLSTIVGHTPSCTDVRPCLLDGKQVELGMGRDAADVFVAPDLDHASRTLSPAAEGDGQPRHRAART